MSKQDIWDVSPRRDEDATIPSTEAPETYDEFYQQFDWYPIEEPPALEDLFEQKLHDRFTDSLAALVGRVTIRGHYEPSIPSADAFSKKFDPMESLRIYIYLQLSPNGQRDLSSKSRFQEGFCNDLNIRDSVSQPTVSRIEKRVEEICPSWADYFDRVKQDIITKARGTEYEDWLEPPPEVRFDGAPIPDVKKQVMEMFIVCHEALYRLAQDYVDFGGMNEVAIDITDWPTFGDPEASSGISGTKPGRNFSHAWQYATLSIVGDQAPMTLAAIPVHKRKNSNIAMRKLFTYANSKFDIERVYLDSGFYTTKVRKVCDDYDVDFVMKAKEKAHAIDDLKDAAIPLDDDYRSREWGVGEWPAEDYLWVLPSEKRASRRESEPDHPRDDWTTFYSSLDPDEIGAERLASWYRRRWAVETKYRVIKHRFLPQCASREEHVRAFVVNYAALLYNMWQVSNLIAADQGEENDDLYFEANYFLGSIVDDSRDIETASVGNLSEHSDVIHESPWF